MATAVDWLDPCARADALRVAYFALLSGQLASSVSYMTNGVTRETRFSQTDRAALLMELKAAEHECAAMSGTPPATRISTIRLATSKGL